MKLKSFVPRNISLPDDFVGFPLIHQDLIDIVKYLGHLIRITQEGKDDYKRMIKQIDKYWEKLFADPMQVDTPNGPVVIQPQRTNNILERFFRDLKRRNRKKSGTGSMNKTLKTILVDTPLVKNLENEDYLKIILDGCNSLEERFEKIDSRLVVEKLKDERKQFERISPEMKKIIRQPDLPEQLTSLFAARQN